MEGKKIVRSRINEKFIDSDGILVMKVIDGAHIDLDSLKEDAALNAELTGNKKVLALYDSRAFFTIEPKAREYLKSRIIDPSRIATAVLTKGLATRILVNFFISFNKPASPMKLFTNETTARKWLSSFKTR